MRKFKKPPKDLTGKEAGEVFHDIFAEARENVRRRGKDSAIRGEEVVIRETPEGVDQVLRKQNGRTGQFVRQFMTSRGYFSPRAFNAFEDSQWAQRQTIAHAEHISTRLKLSLKNAEDRTGSLDIAKKVQDIFATDDLSFMRDVPIEDRGAVLAFRHRIPLDVAEAVMEGRTLMDNMSESILRSGRGSAELRATIHGNVGSHWRRSYRVHEDPGYVPNSQDKEDAVQFLMRGELKRHPKMDPDEALIRAQDTADDILGLNSTREVYDHLVSSRRVTTEILKRRGEIPPEIRKLMGEITDPSENILLSVSKVSKFYETNKFLSTLDELGTDGGYIFAKGQQRDREKFSALIEGTNSSLDGKYTTPEVLTAIKGNESQLMDLSGNGPVTRAYRNFLSLKGQSQAAKTIYSHVTHIRNFLGGVQFGVANGANPFADKGLQLFKTLRNQIFEGGDEALEAQYRKFQSMGIINTNVKVGEFRALLEAGYESGADSLLDNISRVASKYGLSEGAQRLPTDVYMATDDFFKMANYAHELDVLKRASPTEDLAVLEEQAASIVRNTFPNYDRVPKGIKSLREAPIGNFVSFPAEMMRTSAHIVKQASREITSGNPELRKRGLQRLAGFSASTVGWGALSKGTTSLLGWTDEEAEAAHILTEKPWSTASPRNFVNIDGQLYYNDTQFLDSYSFIKEPVMAAYDRIATGKLQGEELEEYLFWATMDGVKQLAGPFASESMLTEAITDIAGAAFRKDGRTKDGKAIFTPGLSTVEKTENAAYHILATFVPGTVTSLANLGEAAFEVPQNRYGDKKSLGAEYVTNITGTRFTPFVPETDFRYNISNYKQENNNIVRFSPDYVKKATTLEERYKNRQYARYQNQQVLYRKVAAAEITLGRGKTSEILLDEGLSKIDVGLLLTNNFSPELPTHQNIIDMIQKTPMSSGEEASDVTERLFEMYAQMQQTMLIQPVDEEGEEDTLKKFRQEREKTGFTYKQWFGFATRGTVEDVPQVPKEPDERIDKLTGRPYNEQAGGAFIDAEDPLRRLGFVGGGLADNPLRRLGFSRGGDLLKLYGKLSGREAPEPLMKESEKILGAATKEVDESIKKLPKASVEWDYPESQSITSADTSINVSKMAASFKKLKKEGVFKEDEVGVDLGGGRFDNAVSTLRDEHNFNLEVYDPFNRSVEHNRRVAKVVSNGQADVVTSNNVLNVIPETENQLRVVKQAHNALKDDKVAYFSVYEGNKSGISKETSKGFQHNKKTSDYVDMIKGVFGEENVSVKNSIIRAKKLSSVNEAVGTGRTMNGREVFKNPKGTSFARGNNSYPVGKVVGNQVYFHKNYVGDMPENVQELYRKASADLPEGFKFNSLMYESAKKGKPARIRFDEAPNFDTAREPITGKHWSYMSDGKTASGESKNVWHHKWQWVGDDYKGFNVDDSYGWSKQWTERLNKSPQSSPEKWDLELIEHGLPLEEEAGGSVLKSLRRKGMAKGGLNKSIVGETENDLFYLTNYDTGSVRKEDADPEEVSKWKASETYEKHYKKPTGDSPPSGSSPSKEWEGTEWYQRASDPTEDVLEDEEGRHTLLTASSELDGKEILYPTIRKIDGELKRLSDKEARRRAIDKGDYITFDTPDEATEASMAISDSIDPERQFRQFIGHLKEREGDREDVYKDSRGILHGGVGHKLTAAEKKKYKFGDVIDAETRDRLLRNDSIKAWNAAERQAKELGVDDPDFMIALASVNFQLGIGWNKKHKETWKKLRRGDWEEAALEASDSKWFDQTPTRVEDFQRAIRGLSRSGVPIE